MKNPSRSRLPRPATPAALLLTFLALGATPALGGAFEIPMQDARASGQADAFTARADDPAAIFYNPAGLTQLHGSNFSAGAYGLFPQFEYHGVSGRERMDLPSVLPHLYAETDFGSRDWRFGLGVNDLFGINEDWGHTGPLRTLVTKAQLSVINLAPAVAYHVNDHLSLGLAANVYYGTLLLRRNVPLGAPPIPEGDFRLEGSAFSAGVTPGVLWKIDDRNSVGAYYRSPFSLDFGGKARLFVPGGEIGPSRSQAALHFPQSAGLGYAWRATPALTLEADAIWTDWHAVEQLRVRSADPHFNGQTLPASWRSGFTYRLGAEYKVSPQWAVRAGYAFSQNAVPGSTFSPIVPDSNYHLLSVGTGYESRRWGVDLAYQFIYREGRHIADNVASPIVDGAWHNVMHGVMLTLTLKL